MSKVITLGGSEHDVDELCDKVGELRARDVRELKKRRGDDDAFNLGFVHASLRVGGVDVSESDLEDLPFYTAFQPLLLAAMKANGLAPAGEAPAATATGAA